MDYPNIKETVDSIVNGQMPSGKKHNVFSKFFSKAIPDVDKPLYAKEAYMQAKYGSFKTNDKGLLLKLFSKINSRIDSYSKSAENPLFACMVEINGDLSKYAEYIAAFYRDTLGYDVLLITNKTSIDGKPLEWIDTTYYMIISWERNKDIGKPDTDLIEEPVEE